MLLDFMINLRDWSDLLLVFVGLSAFIVYYWQRRDEKRTAATLLKGQIDTIEKRVTILKEDHRIGNSSVYRSKIILQDNLWEQNKYLLLKKLSQSEVDMLQKFFDDAEQIERVRQDIIRTITIDWEHISLAEHIAVAQAIVNDFSWDKAHKFGKKFDDLNLGYTPDISIDVLLKHLENFNMISGTTAYQKIQHLSYDKR